MEKDIHVLLMFPMGDGGGVQQFLMIGLIIAIFYFFMIRPQIKKTKDQKKHREALKNGDKIVTVGGIHGKIIEVREKVFVIEVEGNNKLKIEKNSISMENTVQLTNSG